MYGLLWTFIGFAAGISAWFIQVLIAYNLAGPDTAPPEMSLPDWLWRLGNVLQHPYIIPLVLLPFAAAFFGISYARGAKRCFRASVPVLALISFLPIIFEVFRAALSLARDIL